MATEEVSITITANDKASKILYSISRAFGALSSGISRLSAEYIEYGDQVKRLASYTGMSAEETSRLIQVADDAFVSTDVLAMALRRLTMAEDDMGAATEDARSKQEDLGRQQERLAEQQADLQSQIDELTRSSEDYANQVADLTNRYREQRMELTERYSDAGERIIEINENIVEAEQDAADRRQDIMERIAELRESEGDHTRQIMRLQRELAKVDEDLAKRRKNAARAIADAQEDQARIQRQMQRADAEYLKDKDKLAKAEEERKSRIDELKQKQQKLANEMENVASSQQQVTASLQQAAIPQMANLDRLAQLSDAYLKLQPGLERSRFLMENFGRAGMEMAKLMELGGEKIRAMSKDIPEGLIVDEEKLETIYKGKRALDEFNDSLTGLKFEVAGKLLDAFEKLPKPLKDIVLYAGLINQTGIISFLTQFGILVTSMSGAGGVGALTTQVVDFVGAIKGLAISAAAALGPFLLLVGAIGLLAYAIWKNWATIEKLGYILRFSFMTREQQISEAQRISQLENRQSGGRVHKLRPYIVGEAGPELFVPQSSGNIIPNSRLGSGNNIYVTINSIVGLGDRDRAIRELKPLIQEALRG